MIEKQLRWQGKKNVGLGYYSVPPPFNDNHTFFPLNEEEIPREAHMQYGKPIVFETVDIDRMNNTNVSTSHADASLVQYEK